MHSMTGFGSGETIAEGVAWRAEAGSVNRKQLEIVINLPRELNELETGLRNRIAAKLSRGRVQVVIKADRGVATSEKLVVNDALAKQYAEKLSALAADLNVNTAISASDIVRWPGVFTIEQSEISAEEALPHIEKAMDVALQNMVNMRLKEGAHLKADITARLDALESMFKAAEEMAPQVVTRYRDALFQRLTEAGLPLLLDDERLVKEIGLFADRCDITEEITRAESHITQFRAYMDSGEPVGRPLDFLSQELFREINTMGSKANHAQLAQLVVRAKTELEKIREQVQNIE
jgi:uncharacterized protein (TIGR00255 family)